MPVQSNYEGQNDTGMCVIIGYFSDGTFVCGLYVGLPCTTLICPYIDDWLCVVVSGLQLLHVYGSTVGSHSSKHTGTKRGVFR